ncbi:lipocalin family protein [Bizionia sp. KMM 8389]
MKTQNKLYVLAILLFMSLFQSCQTIPKKAVPVQNFNKTKYLGTWYEIARLDFKFEKNLNNTTATYSIMESGKIKVINKGYNTKKEEWTQATGKAKFVENDSIAKLKVSFFGPFYSGYNVIAIDADYQYALVAGKNLDYLWILSREPEVPETIKADYLKKAEAIGFDTSKLIWVSHNKTNPNLSN